MSLSERLAYIKAVRSRIYRPRNAVPDTGITMHNGWPVRASLPQKPDPGLQLFPRRLEFSGFPCQTISGYYLSTEKTNKTAQNLELSTDKQKIIHGVDIRRAVCRHFNVSLNDLMSRRMTRNVFHPRAIIMYLCKEMTALSYPQIAAVTGRLNHTSAMHAHRKIARRRALDAELGALLTRLTAELLEGHSV